MASLQVTLPDRRIVPAPNHLPVRGSTTPVPTAADVAAVAPHTQTHVNNNPANAADTSAATTFVPPPLEHPRVTSQRTHAATRNASDSESASDSDDDAPSPVRNNTPATPPKNTKRAKATSEATAKLAELPRAPPMPRDDSPRATSSQDNAAHAVADPSTNLYFRVARILLYVIIALLVGYLAYWVVVNVFQTDGNVADSSVADSSGAADSSGVADSSVADTSSGSSWWTLPSLSMGASLLPSAATSADAHNARDTVDAADDTNTLEEDPVAEPVADPVTDPATARYPTPSFVPSFGNLFGWNAADTSKPVQPSVVHDVPPHASDEQPPAGTVTATTAQGDTGDAMRTQLSDTSASALLDMMAGMGK